ncbi:hypothetical protein CROQUDRAFT_595647 [Cronartium quercuum f. sp. fusiforme G11]|uniref:Uncharacterized protein n=1 Tax=Cronartium quercuum f. sp. fusiforme G11 TaxID=708437 RepID=A0A9P6TA86_9BASI|nr:hypothetical protein CROQUDRAFT_595647 [Cronartium quercuum f. sp. fusiforme G11]
MRWSAIEKLSKKNTIPESSVWESEAGRKNASLVHNEPVLVPTSLSPTNSERMTNALPQRSSPSSGPLILIVLSVLVPLLCASLWLISIARKRRPVPPSPASVGSSTRASWETVVVDLPSLLDPPEPAVAGLGRLWARVTNRWDGSADSGWVGVQNEDASMGPLEWYAKHSPPRAVIGYPTLMSSASSGCEKSIYNSHERYRSWSPA